ncbi:hypothetical protein [Rahnella selenatireducens]
MFQVDYLKELTPEERKIINDEPTTIAITNDVLKIILTFFTLPSKNK